MIAIALWYLVLVRSSGVVVVPMKTEQACVAAMRIHGDYCYNSETGAERE